jgi:hypothetical protein
MIAGGISHSPSESFRSRDYLSNLLSPKAALTRHQDTRLSNSRECCHSRGVAIAVQRPAEETGRAGKALAITIPGLESPDGNFPMVPVWVFWTEYTATLRGRVLKSVACETCSTEYVYMLDRQGSGVGTSVYMLNDDGAKGHATSAAEDTLQSYLENDFDPVPCPACGHYQRYMFPKLLETKSLRGPAVMLLILFIGCVDAVSALYWSVVYVQRPNDHAFGRMIVTWSALLLVCLIGIGLWLVQQAHIRRFDPNSEDRNARIAKGRARAVTRADFDKAQQGGSGAEAGA